MWRVTLKGLLAKKLRFVLTVDRGRARRRVHVGHVRAHRHARQRVRRPVHRHHEGHRRRRPRQAGVRASDRAAASRRATRCPRAWSPVVEARRRRADRARAPCRASRSSSGRDGDTVQNGSAPTFGFTWLPQPFGERSTVITRGHQPDAADEVVLDEKTRRRRGLQGRRQGADHLPRPATPETFQLVGVFKFGDSDSLAGATLAAFTPDTAQRVVGPRRQCDSIDVAGEAGRLAARAAGDQRPHGAARRRPTARELRGAHRRASSPTSRPDDIKDSLGFFNTFLLVFAFVALFVGAFIIYNTFSIIVAQRPRARAAARARRAREAGHALGRCEAFVVGLLSSVSGSCSACSSPSGCRRCSPRSASSCPTEAPVILAAHDHLALVVGTVVTFVSAIAPARRAATRRRRSPRCATRAVDRSSGGTAGTASAACSRVIGSCSLGLGLFGDVELRRRPRRARPAWSASRRSLVFIGVAMLEPADRAPGLAVSSAGSRRGSAGMSGVLARENAMRNPRRTATTAAALMIGLALVDAGGDHRRVGEASFTQIIDDIRARRLHRARQGLRHRGFTPDDRRRSSAGRAPGRVRSCEFRQGDFDGRRRPASSSSASAANVEDAIDIELQPGADLDAFADGGVLGATRTPRTTTAGSSATRSRCSSSRPACSR